MGEGKVFSLMDDDDYCYFVNPRYIRHYIYLFDLFISSAKVNSLSNSRGLSSRSTACVLKGWSGVSLQECP